VRVILGGNLFVNCPTLIAYRGVPTLRVMLNPLRIDLNIPPNLPGAPNPAILRHVLTDRSEAIFGPGDYAIATATLLDPPTETVHLGLDLRPIGINIYVDPAGLHVGNNVFAANVVEGAAVAINLA